MWISVLLVPMMVLVGWHGISQRLFETTFHHNTWEDDFTSTPVRTFFQDPIQDISRVWNSHTGEDAYRWCYTNNGNNNNNNSPPGLIYIKVDKAASSTLAGINIRLAHKVGSRVLPSHDDDDDVPSSSSWLWWWWPFSTTLPTKPPICSHSYTHGRAWQVLHPKENPNTRRNHHQKIRQSKHKSPILLWTFLRDPASRAISEYNHFWVSRKNYGIRDGWVQPFLESRKNFQLNYVTVHDHPEQILMMAKEQARTNTKGNTHDEQSNLTVDSSSPVWHLIQDHIINVYDFIGLVERMDESLAVMTLLWDVPLDDLIVLSAKKSGGWDDGRYNDTCYPIHPPSSLTIPRRQPSHPGEIQGEEETSMMMSPYLLNYLRTDYRKDNYDYDLYAIVNASLDKTIDMLGKDRIEQIRYQFRNLQNWVETKCQSHAIFPCSNNGTRQYEQSIKDCYWFDSGCGYTCVDTVLQSMEKEEMNKTAQD